MYKWAMMFLIVPIQVVYICYVAIYLPKRPDFMHYLATTSYPLVLFTKAVLFFVIFSQIWCLSLNIYNIWRCFV